MNIGQLDGQPLALQIFNGMTAESTCVNERWAKDQLFRCMCFAGGRHQTILDETVGPIFQSTSSVWRTTPLCLQAGDFGIFQSTSSVWRTTQANAPNASGLCYFNPRPPCGGRRARYARNTQHPSISIHVLRVEDDTAAYTYYMGARHFNPRPPCGGRHS